MRFTRVITGTIAAALVGSVTASIPAPAQAGTTGTTTTTTAGPSDRAIVYGDSIYIDGDVTAADDSLLHGTVILYAARASAAEPTFKEVARDEDNYGSIFFSDVKPRRNTVYVVRFTDTDPDDTQYADSLSKTFAVGVARKVNIRNPRALKLVGKVRPAYKHKKVIVQRKKHHHWKRFKVVRTNKRSKFHVKLTAPRRGRRYFRVTVPGNKNYLSYREVWYTTRYRPATRVTTR